MNQKSLIIASPKYKKIKKIITALLTDDNEVKEFRLLLGQLLPLPQDKAKQQKYDSSLRLIDQKISIMNGKIDDILNKINLIAEAAAQELEIDGIVV